MFNYGLKQTASKLVRRGHDDLIFGVVAGRVALLDEGQHFRVAELEVAHARRSTQFDAGSNGYLNHDGHQYDGFICQESQGYEGNEK